MSIFSDTSQRVASAISGITESIRDRHARAGTRFAIMRMDQATLRDMGISRSEALSIAYGEDKDRRRSHG